MPRRTVQSHFAVRGAARCASRGENLIYVIKKNGTSGTKFHEQKHWGAKTTMILLTSITSIWFLLGQMLYSYDPAAAGPGNAALSSGLPQLITIATGLLIIVGIGVSFFRELIGGVLLLLGAGMMQLFFLSFSIPGLDFINPYDVSIVVLGFALLYCWWYRWSISEPAHNTLRL
jgi:hypothetical protein